ncbi:hypothetical protein Tsubulata_003034, partial [Turnera subulata]
SFCIFDSHIKLLATAMEEQFPKIETLIHKTLPPYSFPGMAAGGSKYFGDPFVWGALSDHHTCSRENGDAGISSSSIPSPDERLFSGSESSSSAEEAASGTNFIRHIPGFAKQDVIKENHGSPLVSGLSSIHSAAAGASSISDVKERSSMPVNFLESFPKLNEAQVPEPPSPSSLSTSKFPNLTLFLQEPAALLGPPSKQVVDHPLVKNQSSCEPMSLFPNTSFSLPQLGQIHSQPPGSEWLKMNSPLQNYPTKGFNDFWLSTTKTQPMKHSTKKQTSSNDPPPPTSPKSTTSTAYDHHQCTNTKLKGLISQNPTRRDWPFELEGKGGCEVMTHQTKKTQDQAAVVPDADAVQLSRMPSLDMDMIWDALL